MLKRIRREQVRLGMFIESFEGNWFDHPFWRKQFRLTDRDDLAGLRRSDVEIVVIDETKGAPLEATSRPAPPALGVDRMQARFAACAGARSSSERGTERALRQCSRAIRHVFNDMRIGRGLKMEQVVSISGELAALIDKEPHAVLSLTRLRTLDNYTFLHSIAVSGLMIGFARHLEYPADEVEALGVAGLLHDIGKLRIPQAILTKPGSLTPEEMAVIRTHPEAGYEILVQQKGISDVVLDVCRHHHRRVDGGGYPQLAEGAGFSRPARVAAICDVYDAVTSVRPYKAPLAPLDALSQMSNWSGHFDRALLAAFITFLGHGETSESLMQADEEKTKTRFCENGYSDPSA